MAQLAESAGAATMSDDDFVRRLRAMRDVPPWKMHLTFDAPIRVQRTLCEACERGDHANCGMQSWCECDDEGDGDREAAAMPEFDPYDSAEGRNDDALNEGPDSDDPDDDGPCPDRRCTGF